MQPNNSQRYYFNETQNYGMRLLKGITRDQVFNELLKYPLLVKYYKKNQSQIQNRILDTLMRQPSGSDCPGFIYGFKNYDQHKLNPYAEQYQIKMGRTKRQVPQDRIYEWQKQDGHQYVELFTIRSQHNNKLESLVHLFFAYARKLKIINGKRRIEWFTFQQKALNAAVTAMINELMEKVHIIGIKNQIQPHKLNFDLIQFTKSILDDIKSAYFVMRRVVILGPVQSGKSLIKSMLNGQELTAQKIQTTQKSLFQGDIFSIEIPTTRDPGNNIFELNLFVSNTKNNQNNDRNLMLFKLKESILNWSLINNVQESSIPCFIVTQSDFLSSQMNSFRVGFRQFLSFIKLSQNTKNIENRQLGDEIKVKVQKFKLLLVISKIEKSHKYQQCRVKKYIELNRQYFDQIQLTILMNATISFSYQAQKQGQYLYNITSLFNQIRQFNEHKPKQISFEYKDQSIVNICEQIINYGYEQLGTILQNCFKQSMKKIVKTNQAEILLSQLQLNSESKIQNKQNKSELRQGINTLKLIQSKFIFIDKLITYINKIKSTRKQQQVAINLKRIQLLLEMSEQQQVFSQLLAFCECMVKISTNKLISNEQQVNSSQYSLNSKMIQKYCSPIYLSNTLIFVGLLDRIQQIKQQFREQINNIIDNYLKETFYKVIKQLYEQIGYQRQKQKKELFNSVYDTLFRLMNIHQVIQGYRIEKRLCKQKVGNDLLQEQILQKSLSDLIDISGGNDSKYINQFRSLIQIVDLIYSISREYKINTNSIISRIKQSIYNATKNIKPINIINLSNEQSTQQQQNSNNSNNSNNNKNRKYNNNSNNRNIIVNGDVKMIVNKKDEIKNERLMNYINSKKKIIQQQQIINQSINSRQQTTIIQQQNIQQRNQLHKISTQKIQIKNNITTTHKYQTRNNTNIYPSNTNIYPSHTNIYPSLNNQQLQLPNYNNEQIIQITKNEFNVNNKKKNQSSDHDDQFYSMQQDNQPQQKIIKQSQTAQIDIQSNNLTMIQGNDNNQSYYNFINQLNNSLNGYKNKYILSSLNNLYNQSLFHIEQKKKFTDIVFNYTPNNFDIDLPSLIVHNIYVIIFARRIRVDPFNQYGQCKIDFKVHYKNRKPNKINIIMISEGYDGLNKFKIEDNKLGKMLMIEVNKKSEKKYKVLDGYYTKNKRNEKKLQQLKVKQLVEIYCKL